MTDTKAVSVQEVVSAPTPPRLPATSQKFGLLGSLSVGQKLLLSSLALGIPAGLLLGTILTNERRQVDRVRQQLRGQAFLEPLAQVQFNLRAARVPAILYITGDAASLEKFKTYAARTFKSIEQGVAVAEKNGDTQTANSLRTVRGEFDKLYQTTLKKGLDARVYAETDNAILNTKLVPLFGQVGSNYGLNFTDDEATRQLVQMSTGTLASRLPRIGAPFSDGLNAVTAAGGQGGKLTEAQKVALDFSLRSAEAAQREVQDAVNLLAQQNLGDNSELKASFDQLAQVTQRYFQAMRAGLVESPNVQLTRPQVAGFAEQYLPAQYRAFTAVNKQIALILERRLQALNTAFVLILLLSILVALVVSALIVSIWRAITRPLTQLSEASRRLSQGEFDVRVPVVTRDEIGLLTTSFNEASARLQVNAERQGFQLQEAQRLQNNIGEFLDVTMDIAEGDLTKRGKVTEDVLGNVVDSINLMAEELSDTLKQVRVASDSVSSGSQQMLNTTQQLEQGAQFTSAEAQRMAERVNQINLNITQMARSAQESADTARQALLASQEGQEAVRSTLDGMQNIRREVQQISKRVKSLGDRSLEIQEIVDTISQIAEQTHLLAVNATIEAAGAGEAGGRFSIVADSVRKLATSSSEATTRIAALIKNVQTEVQSVVAETEEGTREVEQGYRVATTAGEKLEQIGQLTQQSARLAEDIAAATQQQAGGVAEVNSTVQDIATVAQQSEQAVQQGRQAAEQLQNMAQRLNQNLGRFRLPG